MFSKNQYQLLDFGDGRRLEKFGDFVLDRRCAAAEGMDLADPSLWEKADARYFNREPEGGTWRSGKQMPLSWPLRYGKLTFELRLTEFGHVGIFPEHAVNWDWVSSQIRGANHSIKLLNLFAYTGAVTMTAAAAGAEVVHVDSAQNTLLWARRNTESSALEEASVRWITEDAAKFVRREIKRGNKYDAFVLDPPTYGHGPKGEVWKIQEHLPELLQLCTELAKDELSFIVLSCHTTGYGPRPLAELLADTFPQVKPEAIEAGGLAIKSIDGRHLPLGVAARWSGQRD